MNLNYGKIIILSGIVVAVPRWAGAFIAADTHTIPTAVSTALEFANIIGGFGMGILEVAGIAYMLGEWGQMKPRKTHNAKHLDWRFVVLSILLTISVMMTPIILSPYVIARMNGSPLADTLTGGWQVVWALAVTLAPALVSGGVFVAEYDPANQQKSAEKPAEKPAKSAGVPSPKPAKSAGVPSAHPAEIAGGTPHNSAESNTAHSAEFLGGLTEIQQKIVQLLASGAAKNVSNLATILGHDRSTIANHVKPLLESGYVRKSGYTLSVTTGE